MRQGYVTDADGNRLSGGGDSRLRSPVNTWDTQNRLVGVSLAGGGERIAYAYGADGLRRSQTVSREGNQFGGGGSPATTTLYAYDGTTLAREMQAGSDGSLHPSATYLQGPRGPEYRRDDTQAEGTYTDGTGTHPAGKTHWYVYDGLGSVVGEVDPSGNLTSSGTFDVYGAKRSSGTGTASSRQGFVGSLGHVTDAETGLVYMRARYYDPNVGRFISEDPAGSGVNWFAYCDNNPINLVDKTGKMPLGPDGNYEYPETDWQEIFNEEAEKLEKLGPHGPALGIAWLINKLVSNLKAFRGSDPSGPDELDEEVAEEEVETAENVAKIEESAGLGGDAVATNDEVEAEI